jgi:hypothetical protein
VSRQDLQIWGLCFSSMFPCQLVQGWTGMTFLSCSKNSQSGTHSVEDRKSFSWWVQNFNLIAVPSVRKTPLTLDEATSISEQHLPSCGRVFPYVDPKYTTLGKRGCFLGFCVPYFNKPLKRTHWLARA